MSHIEQHVREYLDYVLQTTSFEQLNSKDFIDFKSVHHGKVRDSYTIKSIQEGIKEMVLIITTDRISAFDRTLASIPLKGQVLNQTSVWWFKKTEDIIENHLIDVPDVNTVLVKKCKGNFIYFF